MNRRVVPENCIRQESRKVSCNWVQPWNRSGSECLYYSHKFYFNLIVDFSLNGRFFEDGDLNLDQLEVSLNFCTSQPHSNSNESTIYGAQFASRFSA